MFIILLHHQLISNKAKNRTNIPSNKNLHIYTRTNHKRIIIIIIMNTWADSVKSSRACMLIPSSASVCPFSQGSNSPGPSEEKKKHKKQ